MSDRRTHEQRTEAIVEAVPDLNALERESRGSDWTEIRDRYSNVRRVLERHGFGEAWHVEWTPTDPKAGEVMVTLRVENTEVPQFVLLRRRNNGSWMGEAAHLWHLYAWPA